MAKWLALKTAMREVSCSNQHPTSAEKHMWGTATHDAGHQEASKLRTRGESQPMPSANKAALKPRGEITRSPK